MVRKGGSIVLVRLGVILFCLGIIRLWFGMVVRCFDSSGTLRCYTISYSVVVVCKEVRRGGSVWFLVWL